MTPPLLTLGEAADLAVGYAFKSADFTSDASAVRLLRGENVGHGRLRWEAERRWPSELMEGLSGYELRKGDVILAMDRPWVGGGLKYAVVSSEDLPCLLVQRVARLRAREGLDQRFLGFLIGSRAFTEHVLAVQTGTTIPHISGNQISSFVIDNLPPLPEQRAIAEVLGALDDKIESNRRIVQSLMGLIPLELHHAQMPDWSRLPLDRIARFVNGGAFTKGASGTGRMVIRIAELNAGPGASTVYNDITVPDEKTARPGDLLMSWSGSLDVYVWSLPEAIINQHIFKVICTEYPAWFVHSRIKEVLPDFQQTASDKATTMGHIKREHLHQAEVQVPAAADMKVLNARLGPLWERMAFAEEERHRLVEMRDALLPALLSGRIRVPVATELVEAS